MYPTINEHSFVDESSNYHDNREYAKSWPALVNPTAPSHGGSLVIGTSVIVIGKRLCGIIK